MGWRKLVAPAAGDQANDNRSSKSDGRRFLASYAFSSPSHARMVLTGGGASVNQDDMTMSRDSEWRRVTIAIVRWNAERSSAVRRGVLEAALTPSRGRKRAVFSRAVRMGAGARCGPME